MSLVHILLIVLVIAMIAGMPVHSYSVGWGYYPSSIIGVVLLVLIVLLLLGRL